MKPSITKHNHYRPAGFTARIGPLETATVSRNKTDAAASVEKLTLETLARLSEGARFFQFKGHAIAVVPGLYSWETWSSLSGRTRTAVSGYSSADDAMRSAQIGVAQNSWEHDTDDASFLADCPDTIRSKMSNWITFQRKYRAFKAEGYSDTDCHRLACGY